MPFGDRQVVIGADPDLKSPALAMMDVLTKEVLMVGKVKVEEKATEHAGVVACVNASRGCFRDMLAQADQPTVLAIAVEGQEIVYTARSGGNPRSIMFLAAAAGGMLAEASYETENVLFPSPKDWKGDVPKQIHQARILGRLGFEVEKRGKDAKTGYCVPIGCKAMGASALNTGDWKHVSDAIGLAEWTCNLITKGRKR